MKILALVAILCVSSVWSLPVGPNVAVDQPQGPKPTVVITRSGTGPAQATVVHNPDDVADVVEAAAKKAIDPQGLLTEEQVEKIIDPTDTLEDNIKKVVDPVGAAKDAAEDAAEVAEKAAKAAVDPAGAARDVAEEQAEQAADQQENAQEAAVEAVEHAVNPLEAAEEAAEAEIDRKEAVKEVAAEAIERQLDPTGIKDIEVDVVEPNEPVIPDGNVKVVLTGQNGPAGPTARGPPPSNGFRPVFAHTRPAGNGPINAPRPVIIQPVRVTLAVPKPVGPAVAPPTAPAETAAEAHERHAENQENQQEVVEDFKEEVKEIGEDLVEATRPVAGPQAQNGQNGQSNGQNGKSSAAYRAPPL